MPAPYSTDLRWRIVRAGERGDTSQREIAELFQVSLATVENVLRHYRRTGDVAPKTPELRPRGLLDLAARQQLARWVQAQPDVMLAELQARFAQQCHIAISRPSLCRILQQLGLRRKKDTPCDRARHGPGRAGEQALPPEDPSLPGQKTEIH